MSVDHPLVAVQDVSFAYGNNVVLDHVSFTIERGDYVGIIGPNGGGKTTLLKILVGLLTPQSGSIAMGGTRLGYVPQHSAQDTTAFPATVREVVESGRVALSPLWSWLRPTDRAAVDRALRIARVTDLADRLVSSLSGGQRQRVHVARALASEPDILILDEPFVGIDVATQHEFYAFLKELNEQEHLTILFVSHDIDVIADEVKTIVCLNRGLLCLGSPSMIHDPHVIENLYGKHVTHIHRDH